ncbi:hypothetical protein [Tropicimonas isoalkanivorans]|nr:hypothetical protein [Tropicimonas isoalkanivorans]
MCWFGLAWIECLAEMPSDFIQFVSDRIEDDVNTQCAVLSCEDPASLRAIRLMFFESALSDYAARSGGPTVFSPEILDRVQKANPLI